MPTGWICVPVFSSGVPWFPSFYRRSIYFSTLRFFICELIMSYLFIVSGQVMILIYGIWIIDMIMPRKFAQRRGVKCIYIYSKKYIIRFLHINDKNLRISLYGQYTGNHKTYLNIYLWCGLWWKDLWVCVCVCVCVCVNV